MGKPGDVVVLPSPKEREQEKEKKEGRSGGSGEGGVFHRTQDKNWIDLYIASVLSIFAPFLAGNFFPLRAGKRG